MKRHGFTMIELMIALAIIAILAVIAIPIYHNYAIRARVLEGLSLAGSAQFAVIDSASALNRLPASQAETHYLSPDSTSNVQSITIANDGSGEISIAYTPAAGGGTIILKPTLHASREISWTCTGGTLEARYRPPNCR